MDRNDIKKGMMALLPGGYAAVPSYAIGPDGTYDHDLNKVPLNPLKAPVCVLVPPNGEVLKCPSGEHALEFENVQAAAAYVTEVLLPEEPTDLSRKGFLALRDAINELKEDEVRLLALVFAASMHNWSKGREISLVGLPADSQEHANAMGAITMKVKQLQDKHFEMRTLRN